MKSKTDRAIITTLAVVLGQVAQTLCILPNIKRYIFIYFTSFSVNFCMLYCTSK
jgi:hypothetical protein